MSSTAKVSLQPGRETRSSLAAHACAVATVGRGALLLARLSWVDGERTPALPLLGRALRAEPRNSTLWRTRLIGIYDLVQDVAFLGACRMLRELRAVSVERCSSQLGRARKPRVRWLLGFSRKFRICTANTGDGTAPHSPNPNHPKLRQARNASVRFAGDWSIRLNQGGRFPSTMWHGCSGFRRAKGSASPLRSRREGEAGTARHR